jgi:mono/diheme cytochrome c family protein
MKISYANVTLLAATLIAGTAVAQAAAKPVKPAAPSAAQTSAAKVAVDTALLQEHCSSCHTVEQVTARNKTADEWAETMDRMIDHGMQLSPEDNKRIQEFLLAHYGPK